jgi:hypothetical protein
MHPNLTQALVAERVREWRDRAARDQLAKQARQARREATAGAADLPRPRPGFRRPTRRPVVPAAVVPAAVVPAAVVPAADAPAAEAPVAVASGQPTAGDDRQPAGARAA